MVNHHYPQMAIEDWPLNQEKNMNSPDFFKAESFGPSLSQHATRFHGEDPIVEVVLQIPTRITDGDGFTMVAWDLIVI